MIKKIYRRLVVIALNNLLVNQVLIFFKKDDLLKKLFQKWKSENYNTIHSLAYDESKSLAENVGYSNIPEIMESIEAQKKRLHGFALVNLKPGDEVLDVGCGLGLFMDVFNQEIKINGIELNAEFIKHTQKRFPHAQFFLGDFLTYNFDKKFKLIYFFGVIMYFEPSKIETLFKKVFDLLEENGIIYFQYQHAVRPLDLYFANLSYIKYSPRFIEKRIKKYFDIEVHEHAFDKRTFTGYDPKPYYFPDGTNTRTDTNLNNYIMIARKKKSGLEI